MNFTVRINTFVFVVTIMKLTLLGNKWLLVIDLLSIEVLRAEVHSI